MDAAVPLDDPEDLIGSTIAGRYRIDSVLARGGTGTVFRATHLTLSKSVALKVLRPDLESDQTQRFLREANIVAQLEHRNCVAVFDHGLSDDGYHFMAMPLLEGRVLSKEMGTPVGPVRAASLLIQVLKGLAHAHSRNVVHRDLKPENLFLTTDEDGHELVKLLDFGIAKFKKPTRSTEGAVTLSGLLAGTPAYMSPEQVIGADTDERTDLYATGVIFYEMLAGRLPFDTDDPVVLLHHQLNEEFPPLPDAVPGTLQEIVRRMCDKEKAKRYASASAVLADIEAFLYDATDGDFAASSSSTRSWGSATPSAPRSRPNKVRPSSKDSSDARPGRPWWQWGMAAGLVLLAGVVAVPMMTEEETATATATLVATAPTPPPPATAESPVDASDRTRFLSLLAKVNDRNHPLPFDARRQSLQLLADSAYASKVDTRLHTGLDLVQASESSTPCATFREALSTIEDSGDAYYVAYASQAEVPQAGPTEPAEACQELEGMLERARKALSGQDEPEEDEVRRVAAATRTSKRRAARRRSETEESSKSPESEPSPQDTTETKKTDPPPKLPPAPKTEVPKLDRPELRDL